MKKQWVKRLEALLEDERQASREYHRRVKMASDWYESERRSIDRRRSELDLMREDPVVLVRVGPGPRPSVFHSPKGDCGWKPTVGERLLRSEAEARHLHPCSSWHCRRFLRDDQGDQGAKPKVQAEAR